MHPSFGIISQQYDRFSSAGLRLQTTDNTNVPDGITISSPGGDPENLASGQEPEITLKIDDAQIMEGADEEVTETEKYPKQIVGVVTAPPQCGRAIKIFTPLLVILGVFLFICIVRKVDRD